MSLTNTALNTATQLIEFTVKDRIAMLTLKDSQSRNALSLKMMEAISDRLADIAQNAEIAVLVIDAEGPVFSSGHNLKEVMSDRRQDTMLELFTKCSEMMQAIVNLPQPVIAKVDGIATAAGCQLVASCDLAFASKSSRFATPGVNLGLFCSTPMVALSRNVAPKHAMEMLLSGDFISAEDAARMGLINRAVEADDLDNTVAEFAGKIASKSTHTVKTGKQAFYKQLPMDLKDAYELTSEVMASNMQSHDAAEGISAFLEKRDPEWQNK
ncbi:enoyl-CoA hydratase [Sneathiella glossodoripedis]|uniref:enoyl-CoA hydratase n=1 Tax=Sneathiella glossodoripedis TaxID=418853 RepID=UPI00046E66C3|nr:enoyl-CoA hydratase [Sneathiella glossodoripedis]